jgi:hypothetical protein
MVGMILPGTTQMDSIPLVHLDGVLIEQSWVSGLPQAVG